MPKNPLAAAREFLKDTSRQKIDFSQSDQNQDVPPPPFIFTSWAFARASEEG